MNVLAAMGIVTDDETLVDAALSEMLALPREQQIELDPERDVAFLLSQHHLSQVRAFFEMILT
jgi:superkiller protein 3